MKVIRKSFRKINPKLVTGLLKDFPACGVRYTNRFKESVVLFKPDTDTETVIYKLKSAFDNSPNNVVYLFRIPDQVINRVGL